MNFPAGQLYSHIDFSLALASNAVPIRAMFIYHAHTRRSVFRILTIGTRRIVKSDSLTIRPNLALNTPQSERSKTRSFVTWYPRYTCLLLIEAEIVQLLSPSCVRYEVSLSVKNLRWHSSSTVGLSMHSLAGSRQRSRLS